MGARLWNILAAGWLVAVSPVEAGTRTATSAEKAACEARLQPRIEAIDAKLRAGYGAREGNVLREKRRKLEIERAACGKVSYVEE